MITLARIALWFASSRAGQIIAAAGALTVAIAIAVAKVFSAGKDAERVRQDRQSLDHMRSRAQTDDEIQSLPPADVERRLGRWVRPDDGEREP